MCPRVLVLSMMYSSPQVVTGGKGAYMASLYGSLLYTHPLMQCHQSMAAGHRSKLT